MAEEKAQAKQGDDLSARVEQLEKELRQAQQRAAAAPITSVPANSDGPGVGNPQRSWSLAEQEAATRGEWHDTWEKP